MARQHQAAYYMWLGRTIWESGRCFSWDPSHSAGCRAHGWPARLARQLAHRAPNAFHSFHAWLPSLTGAMRLFFLALLPHALNICWCLTVSHYLLHVCTCTCLLTRTPGPRQDLPYKVCPDLASDDLHPDMYGCRHHIHPITSDVVLVRMASSWASCYSSSSIHSSEAENIIFKIFKNCPANCYMYNVRTCSITCRVGAW